ncbi:MAG: glycine cleavage system protein GcvH [Ruminococcaceae bacterium]|mgnify:FL=1|nr:glycine cleavage system protein GcvH [Oscillospiraceae bacterium]
MNIPNDLMYTKTHEWVKKTGADSVQIGLTDFAQHQLGDIVFVNLPEVGDTLEVGLACADVESVKAVSDIFSPVAATVSAVNEMLLDEPAQINADCYGAWMLEATGVTAQEDLLDAAAYEALVAAEAG